MVHKSTKLLPYWITKTPKQYKRNATNGNLHRAEKISSNFEAEVDIIKNKCKKAGYHLKFINNDIKNFHERPRQKDVD